MEKKIKLSSIILFDETSSQMLLLKLISLKFLQFNLLLATFVISFVIKLLLTNMVSVNSFTYS